MTTSTGYEIAVYYFPQYHPDPRNDLWHGRGWTEWDLVKRAEPRFPGHQQPKEPVWGYEDESLPQVAANKIAAAADHGVTAFIWDWYWYDNAPFLNGALERGYLQADNNRRLKFALMWANHDWLNIHPHKRAATAPVLAPGAVSPDEFRAATDYIIEHYLSHPAYWRVEGGLYFSIYELARMVDGLGGVVAAREALESFRERTRAAGLGELHLNAVVWGLQILPEELRIENPNELLGRLGFDSVTSYVWIHHQQLDRFPITDYGEYAQRCVGDWGSYAKEFSLPYHPNVTMGWDSSPRTVQSDVFDNLGYPFTPVLGGNTPDAFRGALQSAKEFLDAQQRATKILTINAWNEWTEGSYLEPDTVHGMRYLEAIRDVFGVRRG